MKIASRILADSRRQVSMTVQDRLKGRDFAGSLEVIADPGRGMKEATYTLLLDGKPALTKRLTLQTGKGGQVSVEFGHPFRGVKQMVFDVSLKPKG